MLSWPQGWTAHSSGNIQNLSQLSILSTGMFSPLICCCCCFLVLLSYRIYLPLVINSINMAGKKLNQGFLSLNFQLQKIKLKILFVDYSNRMHKKTDWFNSRNIISHNWYHYKTNIFSLVNFFLLWLLEFVNTKTTPCLMFVGSKHSTFLLHYCAQVWSVI